jgi:L-ascorbate metabolism protein UlaG (beta-lactamase superfamily)
MKRGIIMIFKWIGGATWIIQIDGIKIACDPVLCPKGSVQDYKYFKSTRIEKPEYSEYDFKDIDIWLLTHGHEDHFDQKGSEKITNSRVIAHHSILKSPYSLNMHLDTLNWGEEVNLTIRGINIEIKAVPAYHSKRQIFSSIVGNGNGYLIKVSNDKSSTVIYITGDAFYSEKVRKYVDLPIDYIIVNAGSARIGNKVLSRIIGRITNNKNDIIELTGILNPKIIIPVHWGTFTHYMEVLEPCDFEQDKRIKLVKPGVQVEI